MYISRIHVCLCNTFVDQQCTNFSIDTFFFITKKNFRKNGIS